MIGWSAERGFINAESFLHTTVATSGKLGMSLVCRVFGSVCKDPSWSHASMMRPIYVAYAGQILPAPNRS